MSQYAKTALLAKRAYVAALLAGAAAIAGAQTAPTPGAAAATEGGPARDGMMHRGGHQRDPARMQAAMAKHRTERQAELKAKLKLSPEQESSWTAFTAAMTPPAMKHQGMGKGMSEADRAEMAKLSTPERIDKMRALHEQRHAAMTAEMNRRGEAVKTFYASLSADQKKTFDSETQRMMAGRRGMGGGMGGMGGMGRDHGDHSQHKG